MDFSVQHQDDECTSSRDHHQITLPWCQPWKATCKTQRLQSSLKLHPKELKGLHKYVNMFHLKTFLMGKGLGHNQDPRPKASRHKPFGSPPGRGRPPLVCI